MDKATPTPSPASVDSFKFNKAVDPMPGHELCGDYARALLAAQPSGTNLAQECAKARRHGFLDALSSGTARELCALLRRGVNQLEAWHAKYGEHQPQWLPPAGDVRWMEDVAAALDGRAALRAEVERLAAQAASAPAVRMLTEDEVAQATEDGERSFRRWTQGVRGQTLMPQDSPTFHYVMAGAAKALAAFRAEVERLAQSAPTDDAMWDQTLQERDTYHDWADKLAEGIAAHLGVDIGEHTAGAGANNPWANALEAIQAVAQSAPLAQQAREYPPLPKLPTMTVLSELQSGTQEMVRLDVAHEAMRAYVDADRAAAQVDQPAGRVIPADGEVRNGS